MLRSKGHPPGPEGYCSGVLGSEAETEVIERRMTSRVEILELADMVHIYITLTMRMNGLFYELIIL